MTRTSSLPKIGLGTVRLDDPEACAANVATALELGYRHIDTAQMYDNEEYVGDGIARSDVPREDVIVATKVLPENLAYDDVMETTAESMEKLGVDVLDVLYVHWPADAYDPEETLAAFDDLYDDGTIEHVGLSNFTPPLLDEAREQLDAPVFAHQVEFHPLLRQEELRADAREHGYPLVAYSPLARGKVFDVPEIVDVAEKHDTTPAAVALAWETSHDEVVAIPKASSRAHLRENLDAANLKLDPEDVERINGITRTERLIEPDHAAWL